MAYQVLARQWRPQRFDDVVGQDYTVRALSYALEHQKLHSAYLFTGSHGIGKTSLARILARAINCEQGISAKPCDSCTACMSMLAGQAVDVIEIDAASRTKVEDTRELLDQVQYAPTMSRYKIYIIDEVHMLSTHSFNALLKTLEEPPAHVLFLLATTHPDKLPVTVRSRCLQFHLRPILATEVEQQLVHITQAETIIAEPEALAAIAKAARGSMRDALSLLDQAIAVGQGQVKLAEVSAMLGLASTEILNAIVEGLLTRDINTLINTVKQHSQAITTLPTQLLELLQQAALYQFAPDIIDTQSDAGKILVRLATTLSQNVLQLYYQLTLHAIDDIAKAPLPLLAVEMWLLRLVHFEVTTSEQPGHPQEVPQQTISPAVATSEQPRRPQAVPQQTISPAVATSEQLRHPQEVPLQATSPAPALSQAPKTEAPQATKQQETISELASTVQLPAWSQLLPQLNLAGTVRILAEQSDLCWQSNHEAQLLLAKNQASLCQPAHLETLAKALTNHCGHLVKLTLLLVDTTVNSPASIATQQAQTQQQTLLTELQTDVKIQAILKEFDATIDTKSVVLTPTT